MHAAVQQEFPAICQKTKVLADRRALASERYQGAVAQLRHYEDVGEGGRSALLVRLCIGLVLIAGFCIGVGIVRRQTGGIGYLATAAGCFALCAIAMLGSTLTGREGEAGK